MFYSASVFVDATVFFLQNKTHTLKRTVRTEIMCLE